MLCSHPRALPTWPLPKLRSRRSLRARLRRACFYDVFGSTASPSSSFRLLNSWCSWDKFSSLTTMLRSYYQPYGCRCAVYCTATLHQVVSRIKGSRTPGRDKYNSHNNYLYYELFDTIQRMCLLMWLLSLWLGCESSLKSISSGRATAARH